MIIFISLKKFKEIILQKNAEQVKHLLLIGANPNTKDHAGWTPLVKKAYINVFLFLYSC